MDRIMRQGLWHLITAIICTLLGWGLANFVSVNTDGVRITGIRERVEVWRLTSEIRDLERENKRLERENKKLEREVERLKRRPLREEQHNTPGEPLTVAQP